MSEINSLSIKLTELNIYPVKSLQQISLSQSLVEPFGLQHDRRWMVVDEQGKMITQRQQSRMCLIQPELIDNGIILRTTGTPDLQVTKPVGVTKRTVTVWEDNCQAYDAGDDAANWLSEFLSINCRMVYFPDDEFRQVDLTYAKEGDRTAFSDGFPLLLTSQASLDDLNSRLALNEYNASPITMNRFRPNLVVSGCDAFAEDNWKKIRIGDITFRIVKPCSRCVIPNIDIETAERSNEPARTLATYRMRDNKIYFGQNVIAENQGDLTIGMPIEIIE